MTTGRRRWPWRRALVAFGLSFVVTGLTGSLALALSDFTASPSTADPGDGVAPGGDLQSAAASDQPDTPAEDEVADDNMAATARFVPLAEPIEILSTTTDLSAGNATGFDLADLVERAGTAVDGWSGREVVAIMADLTVSGTGPGTVLVHPGNRPADALRLQLSSSGQLRAPHVPLYPDAEGRVAITADPQGQTDPPDGTGAGFEVVVTARGVYIESGETTAGRYQHVGIGEVASLVPATDGRQVTVELSDVPSLDVDTVGHALLRFNANVGADGGSVSLVPGEEAEGVQALTMWPSPARPRPGLGGTGVALVPVGPEGRIELIYRGGSILNVDLVGYFTNGRAERSDSGLFVPSAPELLDADHEPAADSVDLVVGDIAAGADGAAVLVRPEADPEAERLVFNVGPEQRRVSPLWLDQTAGLDLAATDASVWRLGSYRQ